MNRPSMDHIAPELISIGAAIRGEVIEPGGPRYDAVRPTYFPGFDPRPAVIVRPANASDVARVVQAAGSSDIPLVVRGGGHSLAGHGGGDGAILLDLSSLRAMRIDADGATAWADAGVTAGEYTMNAARYGLATGFGDAPSVAVGGITLVGGLGFLHRKFGLTIDSLLAAEVVTADGSILTTDADTHPDLFWAIRGGGGNFGVVTRLRFRLHPVSRVVGGMIVLPATPASAAAFVAALADTPVEISGLANITIAPPMPFLPVNVHGKPIIMAMLVHSGDAASAERALAPLRSIAPPVVDTLQPMDYSAIYDGHEHAPHPVAIAMRNGFVESIDSVAAEAILDQLQQSTAPMKVAQIRVLGGAVSRVDAGATAFAHRDRQLMLNVAAAYARPEDADEHQAWAQGLYDRITGGSTGCYAGFLSAEGLERVRQAYPGSTWDRLRRVKSIYDPANLFRSNQNIPPEELRG